MNYSRLNAICVLFVVVLFSCNNRPAHYSSDENKLDTLWNEDVQSSFWGTCFGASQDEVKESLESKSFDIEDVNEDCIQCFPLIGEKISFGGISWDYMFAHFSNGKLFMVVFQSAFTSKNEALEQYEFVRKQMSAKYKVMDVPLRDSNEIARSGIYSKTSRTAGILCDSGYSLNHELLYYTELIYFDKEFDKATDEL